MDSSPTPTEWHSRFERLGVVILILGAVTIPLSTPLSSSFPIIALLAWLFSGGFKDFSALLRASRVAQLSVGLFLWLTVSMCHGPADWGEALGALKKYRELLLLPVFMLLLRAAPDRKRVFDTVLIGLGLALVVSYLQFLEWLPLWRGKHPTSGTPITHTGFMALFVFCLLHHARETRTRWPYLIAAFAAANILLFVNSSTGLVALLALIGLYILQVLSPRRILIATAALGVLLGAMYVTSPKLRHQVNDDIQGFLIFNPDEPARDNAQTRLENYWISWTLIRKAPLLGYGTGGFNKTYNAATQDYHRQNLNDSENEYLMIWMQSGLVGLGLFLGLLGSLLFVAKRLHFREAWLAQGLVLWYFTMNLFNSFLYAGRDGTMFVLLAAVFCPLAKESHAEPYETVTSEEKEPNPV